MKHCFRIIEDFQMVVPKYVNESEYTDHKYAANSPLLNRSFANPVGVIDRRGPTSDCQA